LANVFYTAIGSKKQSKERLEVYHDCNSYVIEDFLKLTSYEQDKVKVTSLKEQDKGREIQIKELLKDMKNEPSLIPNVLFDLNASLLAIYAQEKLYGKE